MGPVNRDEAKTINRDGWATPDDLVLQAGAVLAVRWDACGVTVALGDEEARLLSLAPAEVVR